MQNCARCGHRVCLASDKIAINKIWHKCCFNCYNCKRPLCRNSAKICYGEIYCDCCKPPAPPPHRINSLPSCNMLEPIYWCLPPPLPKCPEFDTRQIHSCSCIPKCCRKLRKQSEMPCFPKQKKCLVDCNDYCFPSGLPPPPPRIPTYNLMGRRQQCCCRDCCRDIEQYDCNYRKIGIAVPRCVRCGDKVYAAEKIMSAVGPYHNYCFNCFCCCKSLGVKTMYEASGEIYCKQCYNNHFGLKCYGYY